MSANHELRGRLEGLKVKPREDGTDVDVVFSFPLRQGKELVDLAGLGELAGKRVVVTIESEQPGLPMRAAGGGGQA
jgi:hypothetical protein